MRHSKVRLKADSGTFLQKVTVEEDRKSRAYADLRVFTGGVGNPAKGVKRPRLDSQEGKTPAIGDHQARSLLDAPDPTTLQGLRDRALLASLNEGNQKGKFLKAVGLSWSERKTMMRELSTMRVTAGSLFPGPDGACEELKERFFKC